MLICQEIAQYFRADCTSLYLIRYEEAFKSDKSGNNRIELIKWLDLVGAFGPWKRALRPKYRRERSRSRYEIPFNHQDIPEEGIGLTPKGFFEGKSLRFNSGYDFRSWRGGKINLRKEEIRNVVWYQDGLYNSCRCILTSPVVRESNPLLFSVGLEYQKNLDSNEITEDLKKEFKNHGISFSSDVSLKKEDGKWLIEDKNQTYSVEKVEFVEEDKDELKIYARSIPLPSRIGLIKIENRSPRNLLGFLEVVGEDFNRSSLFFKEEWAIASLRPYLEDLPNPPKEQKEGSSEGEWPDPFLPIHNNIGWRQYFEDHPLGAEYFIQFLNALEKKRKEDQKLLFRLGLMFQTDLDNGHISDDLRQAFVNKNCPFSQNVTLAIKEKSIKWLIIDGDNKKIYVVKREKDSLNIYQETGMLVIGWYKEFGNWLVQLVECLIRIEAWLQHLQYALQIVCGIGEKPSLDRPIPSLFNVYHLRAAYVHDLQDTGFIEQRDDEQKRKLKRYAYDALKESLFDLFTRGETAENQTEENISKDIRCLIHDIQTEISTSFTDESKVVVGLIQELCEMKAQKIREALESSEENGTKKEQQFDIKRYLADYEIPSWKFQSALEIVKEDLEFLCNQLDPNNLRGREEKYHYLFTEEEEVCQIQKAVVNIFQQEKPEESGCQAQNFHKDQKPDIITGCSVARALAAATGYADAFSQADELRLSFIAGHVTQVLDNHLLHQARQRGLSLDFGDFDALGLEQFGIGLLDKLSSICQRIEGTLWYLLQRDAYRQGVDILLPDKYESTFRLNNFVKGIKNTVETLKSDLYEFCLISIILNGNEGGENQRALENAILRLLENIFTECEQRGFSTKEHYSKDNKLELIEFSLISSLVREKEYYSKLKLKPTFSGIELRICFAIEALKRRDFRTIWSGKKSLENFLEVLNAIAK